MILQTAGLSSSQNASIEEAAGLKRQNAALQMRYQLALLDRSQRRMSIEECMAALMGDTDPELTV